MHIKIDKNFRRNTCMVIWRHTTDVPVMLTYSYIMSRYNTNIAFTTATLNDLKVISRGIQNEFLSDKYCEKYELELGLNLVQMKVY